jgi:regulator of sirC expression with transglutaminase-like and TPR domain
MRAFAELAADPDPSLDELALALAAEFRPVDAPAALELLDALGADVRQAVEETAGVPAAQAAACADVLGGEHGFAGDRKRYDDPANSMLDVVLSRRRGLPILLSVVYVEAARRAGVPLRGVGLPGHFVVGHFGTTPPLLLDPFARGAGLAADDADAASLRPWSAREVAMRMLNNLLASYERRGDLGAAIHAAELRLALPAGEAVHDALAMQARGLKSRLN